MRYLVTGGAGFIGSHLCENLVELGHEVHILDNFSTGKPENLSKIAKGISVTKGDIQDRELLNRLSKGIDGIFHLAALVSVAKSVEAPLLSFDNNALGSFNVFEAARQAGVRRIVYASTAAVYGASQNLPLQETTPLYPLSPYGNDKLYTESLGRQYSELYGLEMIPLRFFNVYGPRQDPKSSYSGVISIFMDCLKNGKAPTIFGDGAQTRDFVYVQDVIQAIRLAMLGDYKGYNAYNVGTGRYASLNQLFAVLSDITGTSLAPQYEKARIGDILHSQADIRLIQQNLGYQPQWSLEDGLAQLWQSIVHPTFEDKGDPQAVFSTSK